MEGTPVQVVSCVIVAFHDPDSLGRSLAGLRHPGLRVVVVNVEADPGVEAVARNAGAEHLPLDGNPGYAAAVNHGVRHCPNGPVVFMNDDARAEAGVVLALAAQVRPGSADVVLPSVRTSDGVLERTIFALATPRSLLVEWALLPDEPMWALSHRARVEKWRCPAVPERVDAASAILVATTTDLLSAVPLPEQYFLYWEETEWFWRLRERGAVVEYRPDLAVVHDGGRGDVRPAKSRLMARNAVRCVRRTQGRGQAALALPVVVAWNLRLVAVAAVRVLRTPRPRQRAALRARLAGLGSAVGAMSEVVGGR